MIRILDRLQLNNNKLILLILLFSLLISFFIGLLIGNSRSTKYKEPLNTYYATLIQDDLNDPAKEHILNEIKAENIESYLKYLTNVPHSAGTPEGKRSAEYVFNEWVKCGLDTVKILDYDVLLDFPSLEKCNSIEIKRSDQVLEKLIEIKETIYDNELNYTNINKPFLAYGSSGSVTSNEVYYGNYCNNDDLESLVLQGFALFDKIILCKYGYTFRGNKIRNAEKFGIKSILLYDDPKRSAPSNVTDRTYPNGVYLNRDGTQRGTLFLKDGDPLTPLYPSTDYMHRLNETQQTDLTKIVTQVIGYGLAEEIMNFFDCDKSKPVPDSWRGQLNTTYCYGGILKANRFLTVNVYNEKKIKPIYNVLGLIKGTVEPDRYVMVGNHRDSWTFGSIDPSSGTAVMLEVARAFAQAKNNINWRPKRTIIFLSWDAEEYGLVGSTEWVEEYVKKLMDNSVVYINNDMAMSGNFSYEAKASPLLHNLLFDTTKNIRVGNSETSVYNRWLENSPNEASTFPKINSIMGSNSDHTAFLQRAGIPCIDHRFVRKSNDSLTKLMSGSYPLYHTSYETFKLMKNHLDQDFTISRTLGQIIAEITRSISCALILPFDVTVYGRELQRYLQMFTFNNKPKLDSFNISLADLESAVRSFKQETKIFDQRLKLIDKTQYHLVRQYNEQMRNLERSFLDFWSLKQTGFMNVISAPSKFNRYISDVFPFLTEAIKSLDSVNSIDAVADVKQQLSIVIFSINSAMSILKEPTDFERNV